MLQQVKLILTDPISERFTSRTLFYLKFTCVGTSWNML